MQTEYQPKTEPFSHQRRVLSASYDRPSYGLLWEQGTGKTKTAIDNIAILYQQGQIDTVIVLAPNGVHRNWITDEIPVHMPDSVMAETKMMFWQTTRAKQKGYKQDLAWLRKHNGLKIITMGYQGFMTKAAQLYITQLLDGNGTMLICDEAHYLKNLKAKRTKAVLRLGQEVEYRRILTGTPGDKPFDLFAQFLFLDPLIWKRAGWRTYTAFRHHFGDWQQVPGPNGYSYEILRRTRNVDELPPITKPYSDRVLKEDVLDLPPKLYKRLPFDMNDEQRKAYHELRHNLELELESGEHVDASLALVQLLRLQQVTCGYIQAGPDGYIADLGKTNPRLETAVEHLQGLSHQAIIWARFSRDIDLLIDALGDQAVRYDGRISDDQAALNKEIFQLEGAQFFVANPQKGAEGLTLTGAKSVLFYSNSFKLIERLQAEDRCHRIGQTSSVLYTDLYTPDTVDEKIITALRDKFNIASEMNGDNLRNWIT